MCALQNYSCMMRFPMAAIYIKKAASEFSEAAFWRKECYYIRGLKPLPGSSLPDYFVLLNIGMRILKQPLSLKEFFVIPHEKNKQHD